MQSSTLYIIWEAIVLGSQDQTYSTSTHLRQQDVL